MSTFEIIDYSIAGLMVLWLLFYFCFGKYFMKIYLFWSLVILQIISCVFEAVQHDWLSLSFNCLFLILFMWFLAMKYKDVGREETKEIYQDIIEIALARASTLKSLHNERNQSHSAE